MHTTLAQPLDRLPDPLPIPTLVAPFDASVTPPGSKSLTNRALLLAALAEDGTLRRPLADADDARVMADAVERLGARVERTPAGDLHVTGVGGRWRPSGSEVRLDLHNAGTATRFLAASVLCSPVPIVIDGNARMRQRPIGELVTALATLGVRAEYLRGGRPGCPPVRLVPPPAPIPRGAAVEFETTQSSQAISGLLLVAPWLPGGLTIRLRGPITSRSYIAMTTGLLERLGATVRTSDDLRVIRVGPAPPPAPGGLRPFDYAVEPDASGATYFWAAAALCPGSTCRVPGLDERSLQGDAAFPGLLARMGAVVTRRPGPETASTGTGRLDSIMADMADMPDAALTLAVVAAFASGRSVLRGLHTLRVKESDRIQALNVELGKVGVGVETDVLGDHGTVTISPPPGGVDCSADVPRVEFETYDDHRVAMALALIGLRRPNVFIRGPRCVAKTYPGYWASLAGLFVPPAA